MRVYAVASGCGASSVRCGPSTAVRGIAPAWPRHVARVAIGNCRSYNAGMEVRWAQASRRHHIGRAHARHVMNTVTPIATTTNSGNEALLWIGPDDRGIELEIIAVVLADMVLVIHVMPTALRK